MAKVGGDSRVTLGGEGVTARRGLFLVGGREVGTASLVGLETGIVEAVGFFTVTFLGVGLRAGRA